jgi:hypothetical protein
LGSRSTALDAPNKHVEVRHSNIATFQDPRFTKEQLDKMAKAASAKHLLKS